MRPGITHVSIVAPSAIYEKRHLVEIMAVPENDEIEASGDLIGREASVNSSKAFAFFNRQFLAEQRLSTSTQLAEGLPQAVDERTWHQPHKSAERKRSIERAKEEVPPVALID